MTVRVSPIREGEKPEAGSAGDGPATRMSAPRSSFLQTPFWAGFKRSFGWKGSLFRIEWRGMESTLLVLERRVARIFAFAYVPDGPLIPIPESERADFLAELSRALRPELAPGCLFIRFDPPWSLGEKPEEETASGADAILPDSAVAVAGVEGASEPASGEPARPAVGKPLARAAADIQPPDTVLLDLQPDEASLLAAMKPKWRYNVRLAGKKGVEIDENRVDELPDSGARAIERFYNLYLLTAQRDRIALHPRHYYLKLAELASVPGSGADLRIWIARHGGEDLAAIITLFMNGHAVYLYGASSDRQRNLMPAYALQWAAIRAAKARGCDDYDFYGIPPTDDPAHPMAGLYRFKTGFGGRVLHRAGSWDFPFHGLAYFVYRIAERGRSFWYKKIKKMSKRGGGRGPADSSGEAAGN